MAGTALDTTDKARKARKERGQSLVEFALLLPLFLVVIFIAVDFGVGLSRWVILTNATREGARVGVTGAAPGDVAAKTIDTANGLLTPADVVVNYPSSGPGTSGTPGNPVVVKADYDYGLITPLKAILGLAPGDALTLSSCTNMRLELPVAGAADDGVTTC